MAIGYQHESEIALGSDRFYLPLRAGRLPLHLIIAELFQILRLAGRPPQIARRHLSDVNWHELVLVSILVSG